MTNETFKGIEKLESDLWSQRTSHVLGSTDFSNQLLENGHKHFLFFVCQKVQQVAAQMA